MDPRHKKYPSVPDLREIFRVIRDAREKGIRFRVQGDTVHVLYQEQRKGCLPIKRTFSFEEAAIFFKDIMETR